MGLGLGSGLGLCLGLWLVVTMPTKVIVRVVLVRNGTY